MHVADHKIKPRPICPHGYSKCARSNIVAVALPSYGKWVIQVWAGKIKWFTRRTASSEKQQRQQRQRLISHQTDSNTCVFFFLWWQARLEFSQDTLCRSTVSVLYREWAERVFRTAQALNCYSGSMQISSDVEHSLCNNWANITAMFVNYS